MNLNDQRTKINHKNFRKIAVIRFAVVAMLMFPIRTKMVWWVVGFMTKGVGRMRFGPDTYRTQWKRPRAGNRSEALISWLRECATIIPLRRAMLIKNIGLICSSTPMT